MKECTHPNGMVQRYNYTHDRFDYYPCDCGVSLSHAYIQNKELLIKVLKDEWKKETKWAFTLTTNETNHEEQEIKMKNAVYSLFQQKSCPILQGEAYLEYCDDGKPHIHGWYRREGGHRVYAKVFKRAWPLWDENKRMGKGHQGGYHHEAGDKYEGYASVEGRCIYKMENGIRLE